MKNFKFVSLCIAVLLSFAVTTVQAQDTHDYTKSGFGIQLGANFSVDKSDNMDGDWSRFGYDGKVMDYVAPSLTGYYKWYAFKGNGVNNIFIKPEVGASVQIFTGDSDFTHFLFNLNVTMGYTFDFGRVALDVFTGPASKFGAKKYHYTERMNWDPTIQSNNSYTLGGVAWRFGVTLNIKKVGINLSYDEPMGNFIHETSVFPDSDKRNKNTYKDGRAMTIGLSLRF